MNDNATATKSGRGVHSVGCTHLIIVNHDPGVRIPNLNAKSVDATTAVPLPIGNRQQEAVSLRAIDSSNALVLGFRSRNHEPLVVSAVEIKTTGRELELGLTSRD